MKLTFKAVDALPIKTLLYYWRKGDTSPRVVSAVVSTDLKGVRCIINSKGVRTQPFSYQGSVYLNREEAINDCAAYWEERIETIRNAVLSLRLTIERVTTR